MKITLVPPTLWVPVVQEKFGKSDRRQRSLALQILKTFHEEFVGLSPGLLAELMRHLNWEAGRSDQPRPAGGFAEGPWRNLLGSLHRHLSPTHEREFSGLQPSTPLRVDSHRVYTVFRVVRPVVEEACRRLGASYIFAAHPATPAPDLDEYNRYCRQLRQKVTEIAAEAVPQSEGKGGDSPWVLFFWERAEALTTFSRQTLEWSGRLPEPEPNAAALLYRLQPSPPQSKIRPRSLRNPTRRLTSPTLQIQREGGIEGLRLTKRQEDLSGILQSEFLNPIPILADRLMESGFFAYQRRPKREKLRDVFAACILPPHCKGSLVGGFFKACWFDVVHRLSSTLRQFGLTRSEFRLIEGDSFYRWRAHSFHLEEMPWLGTSIESSISRGRFRRDLGWLPSYLDSRGRFHETVSPKQAHDGLASDEQAGGSPRASAQTLMRWALGCWKSQKDSAHWRDGQSRRDDHLCLEEFKAVHIIMALPDRPPIPAVHRVSFDLSPNREHSVGFCITIHPEDDPLSGASQPSRWRLRTDGAIDFWLFDPRKAVRENVGSLVRIWLDQLTREIWND